MGIFVCGYDKEGESPSTRHIHEIQLLNEGYSAVEIFMLYDGAFEKNANIFFLFPRVKKIFLRYNRFFRGSSRSISTSNSFSWTFEVSCEKSALRSRGLENTDTQYDSGRVGHQPKVIDG